MWIFTPRLPARNWEWGMPDKKAYAGIWYPYHVQTADEKILPGGTGYITDIGMCGPSHSVLGVTPELAIGRIISFANPL